MWSHFFSSDLTRSFLCRDALAQVPKVVPCDLNLSRAYHIQYHFDNVRSYSDHRKTTVKPFGEAPPECSRICHMGFGNLRRVVVSMAESKRRSKKSTRNCVSPASGSRNCKIARALATPHDSSHNTRYQHQRNGSLFGNVAQYAPQ